jgi:hypothetical protein
MFAKEDVGEANAKRQKCAVQWKNGDWDFVSIIYPSHKSFREFVQEPLPYFDVLHDDGARQFILRTEFCRIEPDTRNAIARMKPKQTLDLGRFNDADPRVVLGLGPQDGPDEIRKAYLALAQKLHPDKLSASGLPDEVALIAGDLLTKVNQAYRALMDKAIETRAAA